MREVFIVVGVIVAALALTVTIAAFFEYTSCEEMTRDIGMNHKWSILGDCQVQTEQGWIPLDNYRYVNKK